MCAPTRLALQSGDLLNDFRAQFSLGLECILSAMWNPGEYACCAVVYTCVLIRIHSIQAFEYEWTGILREGLYHICWICGLY